MRLQSDFVSVPARRILRRLTSVTADDATTEEALRLLTTWDGDLAPESAPGALFEVWYRRHLRPALLRAAVARLVPADQVDSLRIQMAGAGLPENSEDQGYSLLDQQGITATDFQQNVTYRRALEGELSKTLMAMDGVQTAVVHLALPQKDVFATEEEKPTASVLVGLEQGTTLDNGQVQAVTRLVAGSVEGLDPKEVTVSDSTGKLLTDSTGTGAGAGATAGERSPGRLARRPPAHPRALLPRSCEAASRSARASPVRAGASALSRTSFPDASPFPGRAERSAAPIRDPGGVRETSVGRSALHVPKQRRGRVGGP